MRHTTSSPRGLLLHSDELRSLLASFDAYQASPGKGRSFYLSLWAGDRIAEARKLAAENEVDEPFAVIFGGVQPSVLASLKLAEGDGLCMRFNWLLPSVRAGGLGTELSSETRRLWDLAIELGLNHQVRHVQRFEEAAVSLLDTNLRLWKKQAIDLDRAGEGLLSSLYGKAGDQCVRLTALLHGLDAIATAVHAHPVDPEPLQATDVSAETVASAIRLMECFLAHGERVAYLVTGKSGAWQNKDPTTHLVEWVRGRGGRTTVRDLQNGGPPWCRLSANSARNALEGLCRLGLGRWLDTDQAAGRPSELFELRCDSDNTPRNWTSFGDLSQSQDRPLGSAPPGGGEAEDGT